MTTREVMLQRIREAVTQGRESGGFAGPRPIPRDYARSGEHAPGSPEVISLLADRLIDYRAGVTVVAASQLAAAIDTALGTDSVVISDDLDADLARAVRGSGRSVTVDEPGNRLPAAELDAIVTVLTTARVAIAVTGTIILDGGDGMGRRAISLVPDRHLVVLRADQIVQTVPEGLAVLTPTAPLTMISGPSATSDIELSRVEGVHGPRTLDVIIVSG